MTRHLRFPLVGLLIAGLMGGCTPTCKQTCNKITGCEQLADYSGTHPDFCAETCIRQETLYQVWEDYDLLDRLDAHKECLMDATCDDIAAGVCYDEELYAF